MSMLTPDEVDLFAARRLFGMLSARELVREVESHVLARAVEKIESVTAEVGLHNLDPRDCVKILKGE